MTSTQVFKDIVANLSPLYGPTEAASIAAIVLEDAFGLKRHQLAENQSFSEAEKTKLAALTNRLLAHEPVQYVLGEAHFFGLKFKVDPNVLIPRQETEELVAWVIETINHQPPTLHRILDIGTGSGCIPVSLKKKLPNLEVHALDVSPAALETAMENARLHQAEIHFHQADILDETSWQGLPVFDLIVSNPPYITGAEKNLMPSHVLGYEPHLALFATDGDPQQFIKKITAFAKQKLRPGGWVFFETNEFHAPHSQRVMQEYGFVETELRKDLNGRDRMLRGFF